jgi:lipopolysaccharide export system protein LptC
MAFQNSAMAREAERTAAPSGRASGRHIAIAPPPDREQAFARAKRRSGRVRFLRKAILVSVLGTAAAMVGIAIFNPFATKFGALSFSGLSLDGTKVKMARPKLAGFRSDGQPYSVSAETALQDVKHPTIVELQKLTGDVGMTGGETTRIGADSGTFDSLGQHMHLSGNVRIGNARFDVRLRTAEIDFKTGSYQSDDPVEVHVGEQTTIFSDRAMARNNGQELTFEGHVRTRMNSLADTVADAGAGTRP